MANFTIEGRGKKMGDIARNWLYELSIPNISDVVPTIKDEEGLVIRTRSAVIPGRTNEPIESVFMGLRQQFPGKETFSHTIEVMYEESENMYVAKALYDWKQKVFNVDPDAEIAGGSEAESKREGQSTDIFIKLYKYNHEKLDKMFRLVNCWPANVAEVTLDYTGNESIKYSVTFEFDYWVLV